MDLLTLVLFFRNNALRGWGRGEGSVATHTTCFHKSVVLCLKQTITNMSHTKMTRRTGIPSMIEVAKRLCALINHFAPVIQKLYPENAALQAALAAALAACSTLHLELEEVREYGV